MFVIVQLEMNILMYEMSHTFDIKILSNMISYACISVYNYI